MLDTIHERCIFFKSCDQVSIKNIRKCKSFLIIVLIYCIPITNAEQQNEVLLPPKSHVKMDTGNDAVAVCQRNDYYITSGAFENSSQYEGRVDTCRKELSTWLEDINKNVLKYNVLTADFAWEVSVNPSNPKLAGRGTFIDKMRTKWRAGICNKMAEVDLSLADDSQRRQFYLLCRGATQNSKESEMLSSILGEMQTIYTSSKICVPTFNITIQENNPIDSHEKYIIQYLKNVEDDLQKRKENVAEINSILLKASSEETVENRKKYDIDAILNTLMDNEERDNILLKSATSKMAADKKYETESNKLPIIKNTDSDDFKEILSISNEAIRLAVKMTAESGLSETDNYFICLSGEPDLERLMARSRHEAVLKWVWLVWREKVGPPMKQVFAEMVEVKNAAAVRSGYSNLGQVWREELEVPDLQNVVEKLYMEVKDLYTALHGVVRYFLRIHYGPEVVKETGPIPGHLLGNMWAQNWEKVLDLIIPQSKKVDLDDIIKETNWSTHDMLKRAEDFYTSMGLPPMTDKFWQYSYFGEEADNNSSDSNTDSSDSSNNENADSKRAAKCHGTAANMYMPGDYRMIYCAGLTMEDFYVIHHEMGHIEYYMLYDKNLPTIFQDGANSAFQESVGDSIMYAVLTPQHLQRLGLIQDKHEYIFPKQGKHNVKKADIKQNDLSQYNEQNSWPKLRDNSGLNINYIDPRWIESHLEILVNDLKNNIDERNDFLGKSNLIVNVSPLNTVRPKIHSENFISSDRYKTKNAEESKMYSDSFKSHVKKDGMKNIHGNQLNDETVNNMNHGFESVNNLEGIDFDTVLLLRQALSKIPQVPFGFLIDKYRWDIFAGKIKPEDYNREFWRIVKDVQGIEPPGGELRGEEYFDAGSKFHIPDNTPYVRYFLSSFLQVQMFRGMCRLSLFGDNAFHHELPMPLHRCDIYGSKKAGKKLREMMSKGSSIHWSEALNILTGESAISSSALLQYFQPLQSILNNIITKYNIPIGW